MNAIRRVSAFIDRVSEAIARTVDTSDRVRLWVAVVGGWRAVVAIVGAELVLLLVAIARLAAADVPDTLGPLIAAVVIPVIAIGYARYRWRRFLDETAEPPEPPEVAAYSSGVREYIPNNVPGARGGHPRHVVFLTCDAFGVLPPLSRLTPEAAMYHFLYGYTAKVAGTERGLSAEPEAVFSACFGAPFMTLPPRLYADLLGEKLRRHGADAWLLNTGWIGGPPGRGRRMSLPHTRALVDAVMNGSIAESSFRNDPTFGLSIPESCPGVPPEILDPAAAWNDRVAYESQAQALAARFRDNFAKFAGVDPAIRAAGPK